MTSATSSQLNNISNIEKELTVKILSQDIKNELNRAYQRLSQKVRLKGFRPGKAPRKVLEQQYGPSVEHEALDKLVNESYVRALVEHQLHPVGEPKIEPKSEFSIDSDFEYVAKVEVKPEVQLKKWEGLAITAPIYTVKDQDIEKELDRLAEQQGTLTPVSEREVIEQNDFVECNIQAFEGEIAVKELELKGQAIEVGSGKFFKEIEQALVGKKINGLIEIEATMPKSLQIESLRGKKLQFKVEPTSIKIKQKPQIDDEFAKDISDQFETLDDLKTAIRKSMEDQKASREEEEKRSAAINALIESNPIEVPQGMVKKQAEYMAMNLFSQFPQKQAEEMWAKHGEKMTEEAKPQAEQTVKASLLCEAIVKDQNIIISDELISQEFEKEATRMNVPTEKVKAHYKAEDIERMKYRMANDQAVSKVLEKAKIKTKESPLRG